MHGNSVALLLIFSIITSLIFIIPNTDSAFACECALPVTPAEELERSAAVFSGTVIDIREDELRNAYEVRFDVERYWKGAFDNIAVVFTALDSGACGYAFELGERYLVYAYRSESLHTSICTRTAPLANAQEDLKFLDATWLIYKLKFEDQIFKIPFRTNANLIGIEVDPDFASFIISIASDEDGKLELTIPRNLVDPGYSEDEDFIVLADGEETEIEEVKKSPCFRTLVIEVPAGSEQIEIIGTTLLGPGTPGPLKPDVPPVYITTDKNNYQYGEVITLSGCTNLALDDSAVIIEVLNPEAAIYKTIVLPPNPDGSFSTLLAIKGPLAVNGTYTTNASYAGQTVTSGFIVPEFPINLMVVAAIGLVTMLIVLRLNGMSKQIKELIQ